MTCQDRNKADRLTSAALAALRGAGGELNIVLMQKALFYADLISLRDHGEQISGATFIAIKNGPVVAQYKKRLVRELVDRGWASEVERGKAKPLVITGPGREVNLDRVPQEHLSILRTRGQKFGQMTSAAASKLSHCNPGWTQAWEAGGGASLSPKPIDMLIALQDSLLYADDEIDEGDAGSPQMERDLEAAEAGDRRDWD